MFDWSTTGAVLALIWRARLLAPLERRVASTAPRAPIAALLYALVYAAAVLGWRAGAGAASIMLWPAGAPPWSASEAVCGWVAGSLLAGLSLWVLLAVGRAASKWGWAGLSGAAAVLIACAVLIPPVTLAPAARGDEPSAEAGAAPILSFVQKGGLPARTLYVYADADPTSVDMEGLGPIAHAAVSRAALAQPTPETYAAIGHLLGHYRHKDLWSLTLLWSGFGALFFAAVWRVRATLQRRSSTEAVTDARMIPLIGLISWAAVSFTTPAFNLFDQIINYRADAYALSLTGDPGALCRWLVAAEQTGKADPSPLEALIFYDHPPLKRRLQAVLRLRASSHFNAMFPLAR